MLGYWKAHGEMRLLKPISFRTIMLNCRIDIDLPVNGEYALEIYANDPARDGNTYTHVCQYLLVRPNKGDNSAALFYQAPQYNDCYNVHGMQEPLAPPSMSLERLARGTLTFRWWYTKSFLTTWYSKGAFFFLDRIHAVDP